MNGPVNVATYSIYSHCHFNCKKGIIDKKK